MGSWIVDIILKCILGIFSDILAGIVDVFTEILNNIFIVAQRIVQGDFVQNVTNYSLKLALSILTFLAISQIIKLYIFYEGGNAEEDMTGFFVRLGKSAILVSFSTVICSLFITFSNKVANDVLQILSGKIEIAPILSKEISMVTNLVFGKAFVSLLLILVAILCLGIISVQAALRGVNLAILQMTAPVFATNYITTDKGLWNKWVQNMMSVSLTYVFQIGLTNIGMKFLMSGITTDIVNSVIGIAWLIVTIQSPKLLKEFAYSTGVSTGMGKISSTVMSVARFIK